VPGAAFLRRCFRRAGRGEGRYTAIQYGKLQGFFEGGKPHTDVAERGAAKAANILRGNRNVVALRSASVIIQSFTPVRDEDVARPVAPWPRTHQYARALSFTLPEPVAPAGELRPLRNPNQASDEG